MDSGHPHFPESVRQHLGGNQDHALQDMGKVRTLQFAIWGYAFGNELGGFEFFELFYEMLRIVWNPHHTVWEIVILVASWLLSGGIWGCTGVLFSLQSVACAFRSRLTDTLHYIHHRHYKFRIKIRKILLLLHLHHDSCDASN